MKITLSPYPNAPQKWYITFPIVVDETGLRREKGRSPKAWYYVVPDMDDLGWQIDWYLGWERNSK